MNRQTFLIATVSALLFSNSAYAYLDPGTGSAIIQAIVAGVVGSLCALKIYWNKITHFLFHRNKKS